jgi:hypothetical protein
MKRAVPCAIFLALPIFAAEELSLSARIESQAYCRDDADFSRVLLSVTLRLRNRSGRPVILSKRLEPGVARVARSAQAGSREEFEYAPNIDWMTTRVPAAPKLGGAPDPGKFVVLPSGGSYETVVRQSLFVSAKPRKGFPGEGSHVLQFAIDTWPYRWPFSAAVDPNRLAARWSRYGDLARERMETDFLPFAIPQAIDGPPCR